jgi:N-acetylglucosamine malate deacetylase 1
MEPLDILAIVAHPDDAELGCGGTLAKMSAAGYRVGIVDLTEGELGTRGSVETRRQESADASAVLQLAFRGNLGFRDAFFTIDESHIKGVVRVIRQLRPRLLITNPPVDRHPDHGRACQLVTEALFYSGLPKIVTTDPETNEPLAPHRPSKIISFLQDHYIHPQFVVDISPFIETKRECVRCYRSQFYDPSGDAPNTYISTERFLHYLEARDRNMGRIIGVDYAEGFLINTPVKVNDILEIF